MQSQKADIRFQISFVTEDSMDMAAVRDLVDKHVPGYSFIPLLSGGTYDDWFPEWLSGLVGADGAVVLATKPYFDRFLRGKGGVGTENSVWLEAMAIMARHEIDPNFRIYICDPGTPKECESALAVWLEKKQLLRMNDKRWKEQLKKDYGCEIDSDTYSHTLVAFVRAGKTERKEDFDRIAQHLTKVHPSDALLLLAKGIHHQSPNVIDLCKSTFTSEFSKLKRDDLHHITDHMVLAEYLDEVESASEDEIFQFIMAYVLARKQELSENDIRHIWASCRFAFLSAECTSKLKDLESMIPHEWLVCALERRNVVDDKLPHFLKEQQVKLGNKARRLQPRTPRTPCLPNAVESTMDALQATMTTQLNVALRSGELAAAIAKVAAAAVGRPASGSADSGACTAAASTTEAIMADNLTTAPDAKADAKAATDKRIDPEDGMAYTYDELAAFYKGKYKKRAIEAYWADCKPQKAAAAKAKGKTKAKAEPKEKAKDDAEEEEEEEEVQDEDDEEEEESEEEDAQDASDGVQLPLSTLFA